LTEEKQFNRHRVEFPSLLRKKVVLAGQHSASGFQEPESNIQI
jgi:hypothetical protein